MANDFALDTVEGLAAAIGASGIARDQGNVNIPMKSFVSGSIYCGRCSGLRRVKISAMLSLTEGVSAIRGLRRPSTFSP